MNKTALLALLFTAACGGGADFGSEEAALEHGHGEWDVTVRVTVPTEIGDIETESLSITTCVDLQNPAPGYRFLADGVACEGRAGLLGETLRWEDHCTIDGVTWNNEGVAIYDGNTFEGTFEVQAEGQVFGRGEIAGLRIGDC